MDSYSNKCITDLDSINILFVLSYCITMVLPTVSATHCRTLFQLALQLPLYTLSSFLVLSPLSIFLEEVLYKSLNESLNQYFTCAAHHAYFTLSEHCIVQSILFFLPVTSIDYIRNAVGYTQTTDHSRQLKTQWFSHTINLTRYQKSRIFTLQNIVYMTRV